MVVSVGPLATRSCEPRQIRKEAAAAADVCAGVWLARAAALFYSIPDKYFGQKPQRFAKHRAVWPNGFFWKIIVHKNIDILITY